jgi:hypothetical protein
MAKIPAVFCFTIGLMLALGESQSFAQFGGRSGGLGGIFGGGQRGGRGAGQSDPMKPRENHGDMTPDSYQQTQHNLMLLQVDLQLTAEQQAPWQAFTQKVLAYASDLSRERAGIGIPVSDAQKQTLEALNSKIVSHIKSQGPPAYDETITQSGGLK